MFQVTTLDLNNLPKTEEGAVDYSQDFFGRPCSLTVSGQLEGELGALSLGRSILSARRSVPKTPIRRATSPSSG